MKNNDLDNTSITPVKKWQLMSPLLEDLAIIESESSEEQKGELFNELVGMSPFFNAEQHSQSLSEFFSQEECSLSECLPSEEESNSEHSYTVNEMKADL